MIRKYRITVNIRQLGQGKYITHAPNKSIALDKVTEYLNETGVDYNAILNVEHIKAGGQYGKAKSSN